MKSGSEIIQKSIDSNFIDLCIFLSDLTCSARKNCDYFSWAKNPFDKWFSRVYNIDFPKNLIKEGTAHLIQEIDTGEAPTSLLLREGKNFDIISDSLKTNGFNMFYEQTGMYIDLSQHPMNTNSNLDIRIIDNLSELSKWNFAVEKYSNRVKTLSFMKSY